METSCRPLTSCPHLTLIKRSPCGAVGRVAQSIQRLAIGWTVRGSNPGWGEIFRTCADRLWGPPSFLYNGYRSFQGVKSGQGVTLTPHPLLVPWSRKSRAILLLPLWTVRLCTEPQCLYKSALPCGATLSISPKENGCFFAILCAHAHASPPPHTHTHTQISHDRSGIRERMNNSFRTWSYVSYVTTL